MHVYLQEIGNKKMPKWGFITMILVTYEPMEGVLVVAAGPCPTDRYTWGDDQFGPPQG